MVVCSESSQQRLEHRVRMQMNVNDEVTSLLRYENRLQREIVKELGYVSSLQLIFVRSSSSSSSSSKLVGWLSGWSLTGELSLVCTGPAADE